MNELSELARRIAIEAFKYKKDKGGNPYIEHLERVASGFLVESPLYVVAILHDLLEDCKEWNEDSLVQLFGKEIVVSLIALRRNKNEPYFDYIDRVRVNRMAKRIKVKDLEDNMDIKRLNFIDEKDFERLKKYLKAYKILTS